MLNLVWNGKGYGGLKLWHKLLKLSNFHLPPAHYGLSLGRIKHNFSSLLGFIIFLKTRSTFPFNCIRFHVRK